LVSREHLRPKLKHRGRYVKINREFEGDHRQEGVASRAVGRAASGTVSRGAIRVGESKKPLQ
jgi:hypothetical protein